MTDRKGRPGCGSVAVVGGGLAGLAAAESLARHGFRVHLFEAGKRLGGRAGSFLDRESGFWVDYSRHVALGCCTHLIDFCRKTGVLGCFRRQRRLHFLEPDGKRHGFAASPFLPAPVHLLPAVLGLRYLRLRERFRILRTMRRLAKLMPGETDLDTEAIGPWLTHQGETDQAVERFWSIVLGSALSETPDRVSIGAARKVFVDAFFSSRRAYELLVPRVSLAEIWDHRVAKRLAERGVRIHRATRVAELEGDGAAARSLGLRDGTSRPFDAFVVAVPWRNVRGLFGASMLAAIPGLDGVGQIASAPITAVHLWFDRPITHLPNAALIDRLSPWVFRQDIHPSEGNAAHPYQVVMSASHPLVNRNRADVVDYVQVRLTQIFPRIARARLLRSRVVTNPHAVFSPQPGGNELRPPQETPVANVALGGDWTSTGWPATMESAIRSGRLAARAIYSRG